MIVLSNVPICLQRKRHNFDSVMIWNRFFFFVYICVLIFLVKMLWTVWWFKFNSSFQKCLEPSNRKKEKPPLWQKAHKPCFCRLVLKFITESERPTPIDILIFYFHESLNPTYLSNGSIGDNILNYFEHHYSQNFNTLIKYFYRLKMIMKSY